MSRIIVRIYPPYRNTPVDIACDYDQEAKMLAEWFINHCAIKADIVRITTEEKEEVICMPILMPK